jgi:hypothetical protein
VPGRLPLALAEIKGLGATACASGKTARRMGVSPDATRPAALAPMYPTNATTPYTAPLFGTTSVAPPPFVSIFTLRILRQVRIPAGTCALSCATVLAWSAISQSAGTSTGIAASSPMNTTSGAGSSLWYSLTRFSMVPSVETSWLLQSSLLSRLDRSDLLAAIMSKSRSPH